MKVIIINGPNLNLLAKRNPDVYGDVSFDSYFKKLKESFNSVHLDNYQSNVEGEIINKLQEVDDDYDYVIFNGGGYTHTSVAIADCIEAINVPVIEVHISNIYSREDFRKKSLFSSFCLGSIVGLGLDGYRLAINHIIHA
jgi:3-dehydroquinate dehydratase-2